MKKTILIFVTAVVLAGCGGKKEIQQSQEPQQLPEAKGNHAPTAAETGMDTLSVSPSQEGGGGGVESAFTSMGKVVAGRYADLSFQTALPIERVLVHNGQHVRRGQVLAQLDVFKLRNAVEQQQRAIEQTQLQIEQAHLQMKDVIIAQGYDPDNTTAVPQHVIHNADVKSGYALAKSQLAAARTQLAAAQHELRSGVLTAPFDGVVANLSVQAHQLAQAGQPVCRIIASGEMAVEFRVMEANLSRYKVGTVVTVVPVADKSARYEATVSEINPVVDKQGAVTLRARLSGATTLFDGMNVEVLQKD
jgi:RND family efflux transporter MFP subunit